VVADPATQLPQLLLAHAHVVVAALQAMALLGLASTMDGRGRGGIGGGGTVAASAWDAVGVAVAGGVGALAAFAAAWQLAASYGLPGRALAYALGALVPGGPLTTLLGPRVCGGLASQLGALAGAGASVHLAGVALLAPVAVLARPAWGTWLGVVAEAATALTACWLLLSAGNSNTATSGSGLPWPVAVPDSSMPEIGLDGALLLWLAAASVVAALLCVNAALGWCLRSVRHCLATTTRRSSNANSAAPGQAGAASDNPPADKPPAAASSGGSLGRWLLGALLLACAAGLHSSVAVALALLALFVASWAHCVTLPPSEQLTVVRVQAQLWHLLLCAGNAALALPAAAAHVQLALHVGGFHPVLPIAVAQGGTATGGFFPQGLPTPAQWGAALVAPHWNWKEGLGGMLRGSRSALLLVAEGVGGLLPAAACFALVCMLAAAATPPRARAAVLAPAQCPPLAVALRATARAALVCALLGLDWAPLYVHTAAAVLACCHAVRGAA
jgi:hypothetical protein